VSIAFVLSGGGSLGAVQVGMLQALAARGVDPDLLVGTSAGAVNAAWVGGHGMSADSLAELTGLWAGLRRQDVFPVSPRHVLTALVGRCPSLCPRSGLADLLVSHVGIGDFSEAAVPLHLVATDLLSGEEVLVSAGNVITAVLASTAIPGVLPPVAMGARYLATGVSHTTRRSARRLTWVPPRSMCSLRATRVPWSVRRGPSLGWRCRRSPCSSSNG
jgi:NTE family protein